MERRGFPAERANLFFLQAAILFTAYNACSAAGAMRKSGFFSILNDLSVRQLKKGREQVSEL